MKTYAVIMAGGVGSRFWPRSREKMPKQFLKIFSEKTLIQETINRITKLVDKENIFIVTNKIHKNETKNQIPDIPHDNIIIEPFGRNTAACIGLASILIHNFQPDAVTIVLPSDHMIRDEDAFISVIKRAVSFAYENKCLVTIGIQPTRPETGYGYIQRDEKEIQENIFKVKTFAEKPNYQTAKRFLASGEFFWNSGMFIWRVDVILEEIKKHMPELYQGLEKIQRSLLKKDFQKQVELVYGMLKSISIDYGVMEKSDKVYVVLGNFGWSDVGSWEEVYQLNNKDENGNAIYGECFLIDVKNSYIYSQNKFTAILGLENIIVINTEDALLVANRTHTQDVKKVVDYLKLNKKNDYL